MTSARLTWKMSLVIACLCAPLAAGQGGGAPADVPAVTVRGQTYTPRSILARNMGSDEDQTTAFPPHKVIGNVHYVGTRTLSSYLITTPAGHILINSTYERNVLTIEKSVEQLGFKLPDVRILLGTHAHGDHQEGDALVKQLTGAQVMAMREDVPALEAMRPNGKPHPIDRMLHDVDDEGGGRHTNVQRGACVQLSRAGERDVRDRGRIHSHVQDAADAALRRAARRSPRPVQYGGETRPAHRRRREPVCRCSQLLGGSRDPGGDVPGTAGDATEGGAMKKASDERAEVHAKRRAYFASFRH
jgi:hypothetical protein